MENEKKLTFTPFEPNVIPDIAVFVAQEGKFEPMDNGEWPVHPFAYDKWEKEEMSWYDTCYIHAGLNPFMFYDIKGDDYLEFLEAISVNTFRNFPIGKARHTILCNNDGKIFLDGIVIRRSEDEFVSGCLPDPSMLNQAMCGGKFKFTSESTRCKRFFYQLCGPKSLQIVEEACRCDLHDIKFMYTKDAQIDGKDVFILRTGMAGTLGYEVHGRFEDARIVYDKLMAVGEKYGIQRLGRYAYVNAHCDGSIPQIQEHYACPMNPSVISGSLPRNSELIYRSPVDLGWENLVKFNHEFPGKEALQKELAGPHRTAVHLIWDKEDILKVIAATMDPEKRVDTLDMVCDFDYVRNNAGIHIDAVYDGDRFIGASSGRMLSPKTRDMISLASISTDYAAEGKVVEVLWGNPGTCQMRIKATVTLFPYNKVDRNDSFDVERIPHPVFDCV